MAENSRTKLAANFIVVLIALACLATLAISVYPGVLFDLLFLSVLGSVVILKLAGIAVLVLLVMRIFSGRPWNLTFPWRQVAVSVALLMCTFVLLMFDVPLRIAFAASRSSFEPLVSQAPVSPNVPTALNRRLGIYNVDAYAADPRGGVYFRVYTGSAGLGPDQTSYGFAYQPNTQGTPFGAALYEVSHLTGDWYRFSASDDWY